MFAKACNRPTLDCFVLVVSRWSSGEDFAFHEAQSGSDSGPYTHLDEHIIRGKGIIQVFALIVEFDVSRLGDQSVVEKAEDLMVDLLIFGEKRMGSDVHAIAVLPERPCQAAHCCV